MLRYATLLNFYYFISIFQWISLRLKQFVVAVHQDNTTDKYNTFQNWFIHLVSFFPWLFTFWFFKVKRMENKNPLERKHEIICFMFCNSLVFNRFLDFCENLGNFRRILLITWLKKSDFSCLLVYFGNTFFYENIVGKSGEPLASKRK